MSYRAATPMFIVRDLKETMAFYRDVLGFECVATFPEGADPTWCRMQAGGADVMFSFEPPHTHEDGELHVSTPSFAGTMYFYPDNIDALYDVVSRRSAVLMPLQTMPYGMREFRIEDPNGFELSFGAPVE